jgi:hypothetical protein
LPVHLQAVLFLLAKIAMKDIEHLEIQRACEQVIARLRSMSQDVRENVRSVDEITAPGHVLERESRAETLLRDTSAVCCSALAIQAHGPIDSA